MKRNRIACAVLVAGALVSSAVLPSVARAQAENGEGPANAEFVITVKTKGSQPAPVLRQKDITVTLKNRPAEIASLVSAQSGNAPVQLVFLFDDSARSYLSLQISSLSSFMQALPASAEVAVAYMVNGQANMAQTLTADKAKAAKALRITSGIPGISASPYFCLSSLAKSWPAPFQPGVRRVVFMVTNGEDPYYRSRDLQDPYVDTAIRDLQKAGVTVYSIYFRNVGRTGQLGSLFGQSYLQRVSGDTGGELLSGGLTTVPSFDPYLQRFNTALENQYVVTVAAQGSGIERVKVKSNVPGLKLAAPAAVYLGAR